MTAYEIVFDGGSLGNPGKGYGSYRIREAGGAWAAPVRLDYGKDVTNNEAEYRTLVAALATLAADGPDPAGVAVEVFGDSQLVLYQLKGDWKVRAANLAPLYSAAHAAAARFAQVTYTWQPREKSVTLLGH
jgi:ribonuclease HI